MTSLFLLFISENIYKYQRWRSLMTLLCRSKKLTRFDYHYKNNHDISNKCINVLRPDDYAYEICVTQMLSLTRLQNFEFKYLSPC